MSDTLAMLAMPHEEALRQIIQTSLQPGLSVDNLEIGAEVSRDGGRTGVDLHLTGDAYENPTWPFRGQTEFYYQRLNFNDVFGAFDLTFETDTGVRASDLVQRLYEIFDILLNPEDFINEEIIFERQTISYTLRANPLSQRWRGGVSFTLTNKSFAYPGRYVDGQSDHYVNHDESSYVERLSSPDVSMNTPTESP